MKHKHPNRRRWMAIPGVTICLLALLTLSACSATGTWWNELGRQIRSLGQRQASPAVLTSHQLVQQLADAMRDDNTIQTVYEWIPEKQRDGLSLDQFQQYIRYLRRGTAGEISSFSLMTEDEITAVKLDIVRRLPEQQDLVRSLSGYWIHFKEIGRTEKKFAVYICTDDEGQANLCGTWVLGILDLQDLANLYFDAINRGDQEALSVLLESAQIPQSIELIRASRLISFYQNNISSRTTEFKVTYARMDGVGYEAFGITNPDQTQQISRTIELVRQTDGGYSIRDVVPETLAAEDFVVYYGDTALFQIGQVEEGELVQVQSGELESIIGPPDRHDDTVCTTAANGSQRMELDYENLSLKAEGTCFRHSRWHGQITDLILHDEQVSLGNRLRPGMPVIELLEHYPFAMEAGYIIQGRTEAGLVRVRFVISEDTVASIELSLTTY